MRALTERLAADRGRPIHLLPLPAAPGNPTGLCISAAEAEYVFYESDATGIHREHIILHELGHLVFGHTGALSLTDLTARLLAPSVDPRMVRTMLGRHDYSDESEREAEMFATLILARTGSGPMVSTVPEPLPEAIVRLQHVLGPDA